VLDALVHREDTVVRDFQSDNLVPNASIEVFNADTLAVFDTKTAGEDATVVIDIPTGVKRFGYRMNDPESLETLLLNQKVEPDVATPVRGLRSARSRRRPPPRCRR
jgi:predicted RNase H-like nuclease